MKKINSFLNLLAGAVLQMLNYYAVASVLGCASSEFCI